MSDLAISTATTAVQIWTLIVAAIAVAASVYAAMLLRRTGKGTVRAAQDAAAASERSANASERSAAVAVASFAEAAAASASAPVEEFFLAELVDRRAEIRVRLAAMWSLNHQLAVLLLTSHKGDWETDLKDRSPVSLQLPDIVVDPSISGALPSALGSSLALIASLRARFEAVRDQATEDERWRLLRSISDECKTGRKILDETIGGVLGSEARVTSEIRETRNKIAKWRRERHAATRIALGLILEPVPQPADEDDVE